MANAASTIEIELEIRDAITRLGKLEGELKKSSSAMDRVANSTKKMESAFRSAKNAASALVAAISVQQIAQAADTFTNFANQIRIATNSAAEAAAVQKELYRVSQTTGTAIEDTTKLYARLRVAADQLGSSQAETIRITEIVAKSLAAAGTSSTEASGALLQLAQALNSPKVQAEEFNSLIDGMPNLLKEVEKQLGLTAGSLKKFVTDGNLTNQLFKDAILGSAEAINEQFGAAQDTIATSLTRISNSFTLLIGKVEESTGIFSGTAKVMTGLAGEFDKSDGIVRDFAEGIKILGIAFDKLKQFAINLTKPLRDAFSMFTGGESNPIVTTLNYIQAGFGFLSVAAQYETQNAALNIERLTLHVRDFFIGMIANMFSFFEKVDNFFINQINKIIGYYNSAANAIGMDGDVAPIATSTEAQESALKFERDSAFELAENYRKSADLWTQYKAALEGVAGEFRGLQNQIDSGTLIKTEEQLGNVNLEAANAASSVEKLKEKVEEVKEIEYTDFTGKISQEQQDRFTEALEEEFRIRREMRQLTEAQNEAYGQQLEDQFRQVAEIEEYLGRINERGIERSEVEQINYDYAKEIAKAQADQTLSAEQQVSVVNALEAARDRELENVEKNLSFQERITKEMSEQLGLSKEGQAIAGTATSGVFGAGENAGRAEQIGQAYQSAGGGFLGVINAIGAAIFSNQKVMESIERFFTIIFDIFDPLLDLVGDLIEAINRLIASLAKSIGDGIQSGLNQLQIGQDSYLFGGGFARDFEQFTYNLSLGNFGVNNGQRDFVATGDEVVGIQKNLLAGIFENIDEVFSDGFRAQSSDPSVRGLYDSNFDGLELTSEAIQDFMAEVDDVGFDKALNSVLTQLGDSFDEIANLYINGYDKDKVSRNSAAIQAELTELLTRTYFADLLVEPLKALDDITKSAQDQIDAIDFQNLSIEEQIEFRYEESIATIQQQKALADLIDDEALRTQLLNAVNKAEAKTLELKNKQLAALEREQQLLQLQNVESGLQALLSDFERTIEKINELVQGLFDQVNELLFSDFNLAGPQETFNLAQDTYESLLENAFDADATEDDIKALQGFVNEYLTAARNVFKSSTAFTDIFEAVLGDLTGLGIQTSVNAPVGAVGTLTSGAEDLLGDLPEELQTAVSDMISGLNLATLAFAQQQVDFLTTVHQIELELNEDDFTIDVSKIRLDLGTITPIATAGTPYLGVVTPTVSLDTTSVSQSFNSLSSAINSAIQSFNESLAEAAIYARLGFDYEGYSQFSTSFQARTSNTDSAEQARFGLTSILEQAKEVQRVYNKTGYGYAVSYNHDGGMGVITLYKNLSDAQSQYNVLNAMGTHTNIKKLGFRRGGIVDPMDTIPAMLSPGEYILSPETVRRYGVSNLNRLNSGDTAALNATSDPEVKRLLAELIVAVRENDTEVNVYTDMEGQTKASIEEFRSELRERTRRQGDKFLPARYI